MRHFLIVAMSILSMAICSSPAHAFMDRLVDKSSSLPPSLTGWTLSADYMDTGGVRSCRAEGAVNGANVALELMPSRTGDLSVVFKSQLPYNPDGNIQLSRNASCATDSQSDVPPGTLRFDPARPVHEICDGIHNWHAISVHEGWRNTSAVATLLLNRAKVASGPIDYVLDPSQPKTVVYSYSVTFENVSDLVRNLDTASNVAVGVDQSEFPPINLNASILSQATKELEKCVTDSM